MRESELGAMEVSQCGIRSEKALKASLFFKSRTKIRAF